ncbi:hypothetical protein ACG2LH_11575 [Zhouia sp. PK063]|uniref:hypothetical protein n=1 Tax=Zhouia sp. PK063 TaxID=3373602 RepID=UPI003787E084
MKIQKDNLTPNQKRNAYLKIIFLLIIFGGFFIYKQTDNKNRNKLLSKNTAFTTCKIVGINTYKGVTNHLEYNVNGKKYETQTLGRSFVKIGELYKIKYSKSNPKISQIDYTKPIILNSKDYKIENGIVTGIFKNDDWKILTFIYDYNNEKYERKVALEKIETLKKEDKIEILVNKSNPEISYLSEQIKTE